jgi:hypothetical protein
MIAKPMQTKRAMVIELVLILAFVIAFLSMPNPVPAATHFSVPPLVATPAPIPAWNFSVVTDAKPAQAKLQTPHKVAKSTLAAKPVPVQIVAMTDQVVPEPAPIHVAKVAIIPIPEPTAPFISNPVAANTPETVPVVKEALATASTEAPIPKEVLVTAPKAASVPNEVLAMATETESSPTPKALPASVLFPVKISPSEPASPARSLVTGTAAAIIFAPIAAPVSIIFGIAAAIFTPTSSQLGQDKPPPTLPKKRPTVTNF